MKDQDKTKKQLIDELGKLRRRMTNHEKLKAELKRTKDDFVISKTKYESLIKKTGTAIATADIKGKFTLVNKALCKMMGYSKEELTGKPFSKFLHPEDKKWIMKIFWDAWKSPRKELDLEFRVLHKKGHIIHCSSRPTVSIYKGKITGFNATITDLTEHKKAEEALRDSRNMLQTVLDSIPSAVFWKDCDSIYLGGNRTWMEAVGLQSSEEIVGKNDYDLSWEKEQADSFREYDRRVMESGFPEYDIIEPYLRVDGTHSWAKTNKVPLRDTEGNVIGILGTYEDITERKLAEEALRESEAKYRSLMESTDDSVYVVDGDCRYVYMNEKNLSRLGVPSDKVIGKMYSDFHTKEGTEKFKKKIKQVLRTGKSVTHEYQSERDGKFFMRTYSPVRKQDAKLNTVIIISKDISDLKRVEEKLRVERIYLEELFETAPEGIMLGDRHSHILRVNRKFLELFGYTKEEVEGNLVDELVAKKNHFNEARSISKRVSEGEKIDLETVRQRKDGKSMDVSLLSSPIKVEGKLVANYGIYRDITERKKAEEQLMKSQEELRELAEHLQTVREEERTSISRELHDDIGQNLASLKLDMHLLDRELPKNQKLIHDRLESFMELTDRMADTVGNIYTELRPPLLDELGLEGVVGWYQRIFQERVEIKCDFQVELEGLNLSDHFSLAVFRILQESLTNVRLHSDATRVKVILREKDGKLELIVKDNGIGIKEEQIREPKAFGIIGMEERVRYLGGNMKIKGVSGKGTTVTVRIPLHSENQDQS